MKSGPTNNFPSKIFSYTLAYATLASYVLALQSKEVGKTLEKINIERERIAKELANEKNIAAQEKTKIAASLDRMKEASANCKYNEEQFNKYFEMKEKAIEQEQKKNKLDMYLKYYREAKEKSVNTIDQIITELSESNNKKNFLSISDTLNSLTIEQLGALSNLLFSQIILASSISIVFIFFGDYLINKFKLEIKFPRLAKFINLRYKYKKYYLILNITWIVICILPQIYADIIILSSIKF